MRCISTIPTDHFVTLCAPSEPACFTSCDGPHSGTPDDQRPPHWLDAIVAGAGFRSRDRDDLRQVATSIADAWAGYGFTAADITAWVAVDITDPAVAAECRTAGFNPHEEADRAFLAGVGVASWLDDGLVTAEKAMAVYKGAP